MQDGSAVRTNSEGTSPSCHQVRRWRIWRQRCDTKLKGHSDASLGKLSHLPRLTSVFVSETRSENSHSDEGVSSDRSKNGARLRKGLRCGIGIPGPLTCRGR